MAPATTTLLVAVARHHHSHLVAATVELGGELELPAIRSGRFRGAVIPEGCAVSGPNSQASWFHVRTSPQRARTPGTDHGRARIYHRPAFRWIRGGGRPGRVPTAYASR